MQPLYRIKPENDRPNLFQRSALTVDVSSSHLAFIVVDTKLNIVDYLDYFALDASDPALFSTQFTQLLSQHPYANESFTSVQIICHTDDALLIPEKFYKKQHRKKLLEWQTGDLSAFIDMSEFIEPYDIYLLYALPESMATLLEKTFPTARYNHVQAATIRAFAHKELPDGHHITLSVYADRWICVAWMNGKLELIRSFDRTTADDLCFRLIEVARALNWKPAATSLEIGGMIHRNAAELTILKRFFSQISLTERPFGLLYDDGFFNHPAHFFSPLIQHILCGS